MQNGLRIHRAVTLPSLLLALLAAAGCSSAPGSLMVKSDARKVAYSQAFNQAVAAKTDDGTYEFVLVADDIQGPAKPKKKSPAGAQLEPSAEMPLHQVVYLKVLWRPTGGTDKNIGGNAAIDWYVLNDTANGERDLLQYSGTAFVMVTPKDDMTKVRIVSGEIKPTSVKGGLTDPIGPGQIEGTFHAVNDTARLNNLLAATRARTAAVEMR